MDGKQPQGDQPTRAGNSRTRTNLRRPETAGPDKYRPAWKGAADSSSHPSRDVPAAPRPEAAGLDRQQITRITADQGRIRAAHGRADAERRAPRRESSVGSDNTAPRRTRCGHAGSGRRASSGVDQRRRGQRLVRAVARRRGRGPGVDRTESRPARAEISAPRHTDRPTRTRSGRHGRHRRLGQMPLPTPSKHTIEAGGSDSRRVRAGVAGRGGRTGPARAERCGVRRARLGGPLLGWAHERC